MRGCESVLCVSTGRVLAAQREGEEEEGSVEGTGRKSQKGSPQQPSQGPRMLENLQGHACPWSVMVKPSRGTFSLCRWEQRLRAPAWAGAWMSALALVTWCTVRSC